MPDLRRPMDLLAVVFAAALAGLAILQWRSAETFVRDAESANATVVELRRTKKRFLEGRADVFATVEYTPAGADVPVRAELPASLETLGLDEEGLVGTVLAIRYDPDQPLAVRHGAAGRDQSALVLAVLAVGALFIPAVMRRSSLTGGLG